MSDSPDFERDLCWLLFPSEEEADLTVTANMILEDDVEEVVEKLFKKHMQGDADENSANEHETLKKITDLSESQDTSLVSEFLFLIKWTNRSYQHSTWEPLSAIS